MRRRCHERLVRLQRRVEPLCQVLTDVAVVGNVEAEVVEQANHFLMQIQAASYSWVMAPRVDYPRFYLGLLEPLVWNWALPCPDFRYRWAFVDGAQTYRIRGKRGDARFLDIQLMPALGRALSRS